MPFNRGTRHKPKWVGHVKYKDQKKWVGTHSSMEEYRKAEHRCLTELREQVDNPSSSSRRKIPTVRQFADAQIHENGRITMSWPEGQHAHKESGRRDSTISRMRDGLRPFIREFGDGAWTASPATRP